MDAHERNFWTWAERIAAATNDRWQSYAALQAQYRANYPGATSEQHEAAMSRLSQLLGGLMAGDWIKMRVNLSKDPSVVAMADFLAEQREFMDWLSDPVRRHCDVTAYEHVTRNVTVAVTVTGLLAFWGLANAVGKPDSDDLLMRFCTLEAVDEASGVPCFGAAMAFVDWAIPEVSADGKPVLRLPKFLINNVPSDDRGRKSNAERQRRFREKQAESSNADGNAPRNAEDNVTRNVTVTDRIDKRRIYKDKGKTAFSKPEGVQDSVWADFTQMRKAKGAPITATAIQGLEREAAKAHVSLNDALATCCERGWRGFKAEWMNGSAGGAPADDPFRGA